MDKPTRSSELDERLRRALTADPEATRRVLAAALSAQPGPVARRRATVAVAAAILLALGLGIWRWIAIPPAPSTPALTITNRGSLMVIEAEDGRRWIVGPAPALRPKGGYVIVVSE